MTAVRNLLDEKGHDVWSVHPDDTVFDAIQLMANKDVGAVVVKEDDRLVGIFTERDYARNVFLKGKSSPETAIREIMTPSPVCARPESTVEECMAVMTERHMRHLPVLDENRLVGMVSIGDLVRSIIADQEFTIKQLEQFIHG